MKRLLAVLVAICLVSTGCAGWQKQVGPVLSDAEAYVADAQQILYIAQVAANLFFLAKPSADAQAKVEKVLADAHLAVDTAIRTTHAAKEANAEQLDAAWADFQTAYRELVALMKDLGILGADGKFAVKRGTVSLPEPLALRHK